MRSVVCVKQVLDASVPLRVVNGVVEQDAPWPIRRWIPAERAALEGALRLREECGGEVIAVSVGGAEAAETLRACLARGADRATRVRQASGLDPVSAARAVTKCFAGMEVDVVWCGNRSGDGGSGQFPAEVAERLNSALVTAVVAVSVTDDGELRVERRLERGDREIVRCPRPAVLAVEATLAAARYVSVRAQNRVASAITEEICAEHDGAEGCEPIALEPARPRPKRVTGPDAKLSAADRLRHLLGGGVQQKQTGEFVEGSPQEVAAAIVRFLEEKGFAARR